MAQCANLLQEIRNGKGLGATQVMGWLPLVCFTYPALYGYLIIRNSIDRFQMMKLR